uniref:EDR1/CTR1/ARMC3-like peptidase-like domain-containing protein n=1 Tax=Lactuca sativa TaxID=4236 RepID=A0A9R1XQJ3_LACSA|nr:hypothetical protein LSAT_V11C200075690 [Lactuca sativa]
MIVVYQNLEKAQMKIYRGTTVTDEDELFSMWKECSDDLKDCLGSVLLPIGSLSVGLCSDHALPFKGCCRFIFYFIITIITLIFSLLHFVIITLIFFLYFTSFFL